MTIHPFLSKKLQKNVPFTEWFQLNALKEYHQHIVTAEDFMQHLAQKNWPIGQRKGYCWLPLGNKGKCVMKEGLPFKAFWDGFNIEFDERIVYHLSFYADDKYVKEEWKSK